MGERIVLHLTSAAALPEAFVREALEEAEIEFEGIEKSRARVF